MKVVGFLLVLVAMNAIDHGGGITWGLVLILVSGVLMMFPALIQYLFEGSNGKGQ